MMKENGSVNGGGGECRHVSMEHQEGETEDCRKGTHYNRIISSIPGVNS